LLADKAALDQRYGCNHDPIIVSFTKQFSLTAVPKDKNIPVRLFLLRHAKARFAQPGIRDFDRPLDAVGKEDATALGKEIARRGWMPELVICSTALRARETCEAAGCTDGNLRLSDDLYSADAAGYLEIVRQSGATSSLMLVGHNPMIEDLVLALTTSSDPLAEQIQRSGFPTAGMAVIEFDGTFDQIEPAQGRFVGLLTPGF
jgi:phosphohistidine phosphatase